MVLTNDKVDPAIRRDEKSNVEMPLLGNTNEAANHAIGGESPEVR